ncbi:MAG TPA: hypothetical protein VJV79_20925, partial [Polyangiaceae bacterium]|nr:hypothetical protein [Polyangiaceae bacterium]
MAPELPPESEPKRDRLAPAPPPAQAAPTSASQGFNPKGHRVLIELLVIGAVLVGVGISALR